MKRILYILSFLFALNSAVLAQDDGNTETIQERMTEYVQKRLSLSKAEAEKFTPVFLNYFKELRQTNKQYRGDRLVLQQKVVDLKLRYRDQFKPIVGEKRSNEVFNHANDFIEEAKRVRQDRMQSKNDKVPGRRKGGLLP